MNSSPKRRELAALGGLLALALAGYGFLLAPGLAPYSPHSDALSVGLGLKETLYRSLWTTFELPLWQSQQMSGGVALTNPQALYLHPLHALFLLLPPAAALGPTLWLHLLVAGGVFYLVGRRLGLALAPSLLMGASGLFNFKLLLAAYAGWLPILPSIALSPLLALTVYDLSQRPSLGRGLGFAAVAALCLSSGHIQIVYYTTIGCVVFLAVCTARWLRASQAQHARQVLALLLAGSALALLLCAYLYVPVLAELPLMSRSQASYGYFLSGHATTLPHLATFLWPEVLGTPRDHSYPAIELWEDAAYFGLVPLSLAGYGALRSQRTRLARGLGVTFLSAVALSMDTPLLHALWLGLPGMKLFHCPSRALFLASFAGIVLAGLGLERALSQLRRDGARRLLVAAALAVVGVEGALHARAYLTLLPHETLLPHPSYQRVLAADRSLFRVAPVNQATINAGWAAHLGLQLVSGYDPYSLSHYARYFDLVVHGRVGPDRPRPWLLFTGLSRIDLLERLNAKYVVASSPLRFPDSRFSLVATLPDQPAFKFYTGLQRRTLYVYRNARARPRAFFASEVRAVGSEQQALAALAARSLGDGAIAQARALPDLTHATPEDRVEITSAAPGKLSLRLRNARPRYLVLSEIYHPGWRATLQGRPLPLYRTDYALLGAVIPAGRDQQLRLVFEPLSWPLARALTGLGVLAFALLAALALRAARRPAATAATPSRAP